MTRKTAITWVGVVSGILTILLAFNDPFKDKARLSVYIKSQEYITPEIIESQDTQSYGRPRDVSVMTVENVGELPARNVHVDFKKSYSVAFSRIDDVYEKFEPGDKIYIDRLEPDESVDIFYWSSFNYMLLHDLDKSFSVSSEDSGKAVVRTDISGDGVIWYIENYLFLFVAVPFAIIFLAFLYWVDMVERLNRKIKDADKSGDPESKLRMLSYSWSIGVLSDEEFQSKAKVIVDSLDENKI